LIDNASTHMINNTAGSLSNVHVHSLPPNTTAHLQPCDAGIINSFKVSII
jgi:DDE superfamily endonuclease